MHHITDFFAIFLSKYLSKNKVDRGIHIYFKTFREGGTCGTVSGRPNLGKKENSINFSPSLKIEIPNRFWRFLFWFWLPKCNFMIIIWWCSKFKNKNKVLYIYSFVSYKPNRFYGFSLLKIYSKIMYDM